MCAEEVPNRHSKDVLCGIFSLLVLPDTSDSVLRAFDFLNCQLVSLRLMSRATPMGDTRPSSLFEPRGCRCLILRGR